MVPTDAALAAIADGHLAGVEAANAAFFEAEADRIADLAAEMAARFRRGGRLFIAAGGAFESDGWHVSVEFVHPVLVGKRSLPAMVVEPDSFDRLTLLARPDDMLMAIGTGKEVAGASAAARSAGLFALALVDAAGEPPPADAVLRVPAHDPLVVQEVHETCYHVLYELVQLFIEREGFA